MRKLNFLYRLVLFLSLLQLSFFSLLQAFGLIAGGGNLTSTSGLGLLVTFALISAAVAAGFSWYFGNYLRTRSIRTQVWVLILGLLVIALTSPPTFIYLD